MNAALTSLIAASVTFLGTHFALSHPLRAPLVKVIGAVGFQIVYSLVALASFGWMILAFRAVGPGGVPLWNGSSDALWGIASLLTLIALTLFLGSLVRNPAFPAPGTEKLAVLEPHGAFLVTRHPMMWGFALWGLAHILVSPTPRSLVLAGAVLFLALIGAHLQDGKKQALMGEAWGQWESKTSYWPRWVNLAQLGWKLWLAGLAGWLLATWAHVWLDYIPAGVWRWL